MAGEARVGAGGAGGRNPATGAMLLPAQALFAGSWSEDAELVEKQLCCEAWASELPGL